MNDELVNLIKTLSYQTGDFVLASGKRSTEYFNLKKTIFHPRGANVCVSAITEMMETQKLVSTIKFVGGPEMGAVPLLPYVASVSGDFWGDASAVGSFFVRKSTKGHGDTNDIQGVNPEDLVGAAILMIEDVTTSGESLLKTIRLVRALGGCIDTAITILDRQQGAVAALADEGVRLHALVTAEQVRTV